MAGFIAPIAAVAAPPRLLLLGLRAYGRGTTSAKRDYGPIGITRLGFISFFTSAKMPGRAH
ncbi:MAG: hypothetical protein EAY75_00915 [Bacteroidetes bacterium]|nr:MAG: hypothetical protein EAY75_00915 [Bacteroidota bacterium]